MSYELSGLGAVRVRPVHKIKKSKLPHPAPAWGRIQRIPGGEFKRRTRPHQIFRTMPRLPVSATDPSNLSGLGFSLKRPK